MVPSDAELFGQWCAGDRRAGGQLFKRHFTTLYAFFGNTSVTGVDDLVQKTFLACVEGRDRIQDHSSFRAYMLGTARNVLYRAIDEWNRKGKHFDHAVSSLHDIDPSPSRVLAEKVEHRVLLEALRRIPIDNQIALQMYYLQGIRGPALAEILGIPEASVRSRIRRGLEKLNEVIAELGPATKLLDAPTEELEKWLESLAEVVVPPAQSETGAPQDGESSAT
jgi:RNA polymerase sigma factor (sigma-70 family)